MTMSGVIEVGGSGLAAYNPISRLEDQTSDYIWIGVETSAGCCWPGGVEALLKLNGPRSSSTRVASIAEPPSQPENPFQFLEEDDPSGPLSLEDASRKGFGGFLKKVAHSSAKTLEKKMHSLAIRADQGRNPDLTIVGVYDKSGKLLSMTELQPLPVEAAPVRYRVPLRVPIACPAVTIKLWMRSGAALLQTTKAAKNYCLGSADLDVARLAAGLAASPAVFANVQLASPILVAGQVQLVALPDAKWPVLGGRGWSLADPTHLEPWYHTPLQARYVWRVAESAKWLAAAERTVESTVVLPLAATWAKLAAAAAQQSLRDAEATASRLQALKLDSAVGDYCDVEIRVMGLQVDPTKLRGVQPLVSLAWQRPDSILEVELTPPQRVPIGMGAPGESVACRFYPPACHQPLPSILQALGGRLPAQPGFLLGNVQLTVVLSGIVHANPFDPVGPSIKTTVEQEVWWTATLNMEQLLVQQQQQTQSLPDATRPTLDCPLYDAAGQRMGSLAVTAALQMQRGTAVDVTVPSPATGLVSLVGLPVLCAVTPPLDVEAAVGSDADSQRRHAQLSTMGAELSYAYLDWHVREQREPDVEALQSRAAAYQAALEETQSEELPAYEDRRPRPFRPSSSRSEALLSGIPFNVHTATLSLSVLDSAQPALDPPGSVFYNTTCGAPADHARDFGNLFKDSPFSSPVGSVSGGLRRLEAKRQELADLVKAQQNVMIEAIASYFGKQRQAGRAAMYVPARNMELQSLKKKLFDSVQALHHVTWQCAMRRASVFSQALGIALTTYLSSLSDPAKCQTTWPQLWTRHGYLVSFEGLLSAAGKELGMIEDASVAIGMLRMVQVVLVKDAGSLPQSTTRSTIPGSPYLKWIDLTTCGQFASRQFTVYLGIAPAYYDRRIPAPLQSNTPVRFCSLLFEVGVDIRQWGANAGSNVIQQWDQRNSTGGSMHSSTSTGSIEEATAAPAGLVDDEDEEMGVQDDDVLVQLNYEAFRLLNAYAHLISPANSATTAAAQKTHPLLEKLYQHIVSSAGKMDHNILDEAASLAQQLGGGGAVFCKSGKDRTAMHITFKQAQFVFRYRKQAAPDQPVPDTTLQDATLMRVHGTRLPICEKNVGDAKYAFNALQVKFMPDALKPPASTLAGFLKGGKIFTGGGIES